MWAQKKKKKDLFLYGLQKNGGHSVWKNTSCQNLPFFAKIVLKFVKMHVKCFDFYVKFFTNLEKDWSLGVD